MNTSSEAFLLGSPGQPNYAAAKAGIAALTVSTARGCARYGVRANAICPRARTAMVAGIMSPPPDDGPDPIAPEHVTPLVTYLASPAAERINGEVFVVHGGVAAVLNPPTIRAVFHADTPDGMWTLPAVHDALAAEFAGQLPRLPRLRLHRDHVPGHRDHRLRHSASIGREGLNRSAAILAPCWPATRRAITGRDACSSALASSAASSSIRARSRSASARAASSWPSSSSISERTRCPLSPVHDGRRARCRYPVAAAAAGLRPVLDRPPARPRAAASGKQATPKIPGPKVTLPYFDVPAHGPETRRERHKPPLDTGPLLQG